MNEFNSYHQGQIGQNRNTVLLKSPLVIIPRWYCSSYFLSVEDENRPKNHASYWSFYYVFNCYVHQLLVLERKCWSELGTPTVAFVFKINSKSKWFSAMLCPVSSGQTWDKPVTMFMYHNMSLNQQYWSSVPTRVATKIFEDFGGALNKAFIRVREPVSIVHYTRPGTCINLH